MDFVIRCYEEQPSGKFGEWWRSYEKENCLLIHAGDKVPTLKNSRCSVHFVIQCCFGEEINRKLACCKAVIVNKLIWSTDDRSDFTDHIPTAYSYFPRAVEGWLEALNVQAWGQLTRVQARIDSRVWGWNYFDLGAKQPQFTVSIISVAEMLRVLCLSVRQKPGLMRWFELFSELKGCFHAKPNKLNPNTPSIRKYAHLSKCNSCDCPGELVWLFSS